MSHIIGFGRHARETYPEGPRSSGVGPQGPQGASGAQGPAGAQGAQGPQGDPAIGGYGLYSARPAAGNLGARYISSDGGPEWVDDSTVWRPLFDGHPGKQVPLVAALTTFGGATWIDSTGTIFGSSGNVGATSGIVAAKTGASDTIGHCSVDQLTTNGYGGLVVRDAATQAQIILGIGTNGAIQVSLWTDDNTFLTDVATNQVGIGPVWIRIVDDGAGLTFYRSNDGVNWQQIDTGGSTPASLRAFVVNGGDQIGFAMARSGGVTMVCDSFVSV